ncbi:alpha/beta hydrolase [Phytohabitans sp. ZYX-F-186]|uniref:Alpha/beta hydrolase n=1 Tax=Phytohabitans maris TaxID=3071409 RepID=A0ABU0ZVZ8_9ACTN|nr:alpha/beta hydrolase [Phytohabitans sp. ZYX-F-186]MDQ7910385.1 alpha/beta hydrolase [Phytohabitans sp. ZYX-F-186]
MTALRPDPRLTDPDAARAVAEVQALGLAPRHLAGLAVARARVRRPPAPPDIDPGVRVTGLTLPGERAPRPARLYRPATGAEAATLLYLHGGGWALGDLEINDGVCRAIALRAGVAVLSLDYRLAPEHPFPAALDDATAALRKLASGLSTPDGVPLPEVLAVGGLSAGGALAAALARRSRDGAAPPVAHQLLICPVLDCDLDRPSYRRYGRGLLLSRDDMAWFWDMYLPDRASRRDPDASPLRAPDLGGLPPATIVVAGADPLRDEAEEYATRLATAGVPVEWVLVEGVPHGFVGNPAIRSGPAALARAGAAMARRLAAAAPVAVEEAR